MSTIALHAAGEATRIAVDAQTIDDLDTAICRLARHLHAETYRLLVLVREFDDRFGYAKWSFRSCAEWLAWRCQLSLSTAREQVRTAQALRALPAISAAFADGRISYSKVRALTRVAQVHDEDLLLAYALDATAPQVEERCRQMRNVAPASVESARHVWERRSLTVARHANHGTMLITVEVPIEDGEVIVRALDCAVAAGEVALGRDYVAAHGADRAAVEGWRAQQADALVVVAKAYLASDGEETVDADTGEVTAQSSAHGSSVADHYQMIVHVDEKALRGHAGRSDLPIETVRRLSCDGSLIALIEDERGTPLALGRKRRVVSAALKKALWSRDGGCTFPGCHRTRYVDAHHLKHWINGGDTNPDNLTLLCTYHHRLLHEGGFAIRRRHDGALDFLRADGRVIPRSGYRLEDMVDEEVGENLDKNIGDAPSSMEGFCPTMGQGPVDDRNAVAEVRETAAVYRFARQYAPPTATA